VKLRQPVGSNGPPVWNALFGIVRPDVTKIVLALGQRSGVTLRPVAAAGCRWVGVVLPPVVASVTKATVYSGGTELGYSVPFYGGVLRPGTYFVSWFRPARRGRPRSASTSPPAGLAATAGMPSSTRVRGATAYRLMLLSPMVRNRTASRPRRCWRAPR
jgi:hypothetical protein